MAFISVVILVNSLKHHNFYWAGGIILLALFMRFFWLVLFQNQIGFDSVRFLWISEHVMRGDYKLLPQLFITPLLPVVIGFIAKFTGNPLDSGRIIGILGNTLGSWARHAANPATFSGAPMACLVDGAWFSRQSCLVPAVGNHSGGKFFLSLSVVAASPSFISSCNA